ncbi:MAG: DUF4340 domain-containing protein [Myxococcota bacterium]
MSKRTTIVLAVIASGLLAFILLYERHTLSSGELAERGDRLLERFVRDKVDRLEIERGEERIVLIRKDEDEVDLSGAWRLVEPVEAPADEDAVESLLGSLEWANARRELSGIGAEDRERFGLAGARLRAWYTVADQRVPIVVGEQDPTEGGYYVQLDDREAAYVVGKDFVEALDREAGHFRDKALFPELEPGDAEAITLEGEAGKRSLARREERWWVTAPFEAYADRAAVDGVLDAVLGLRATRFVAEQPEDAEDYGLHAPATRARVEGAAPGEDEDGAGEPWKAALSVGDPCPEGEGERYARAGDGPVVCVKEADLEPLGGAAEELRSTRLTTVGEAALARAEVVRGGATVVLEAEEDGWTWRSGQAEGAADPGAVTEWLRTLREARAEAFEPLQQGGARQGLSQPQAKITLTTDQGREVVLYLGAGVEDDVWARRGTEPFALRVAGATAAAFDPGPVRFRERALIREHEEAAKRIVVERGGVIERLERQGEGWGVTAPLAQPADRVVVRELVRHLASLKAERFVAAAPGREHGLGSPRWTVTVRFEGAAPGDDAGDEEPRERVLRIGAEAPGGAYAQLGEDSAVFVAPRAVVDAVAEPLISRDLLATGAQEVASLRIDRGRQVVELTCEDGTCSQAGGQPADRERTRRLLDRLGALRATAAVAYGPAPPAHGLNEPRARVTVNRVADAGTPEEYTMVIGATEGEGEDAKTHVRRSDLDVGFLFPRYVADTFVEYAP